MGRMNNLYKIIITTDFEKHVYEKFINYALSMSDAFMLVTYRYGNIEKMFCIPESQSTLEKE